MQKDNLLGLKDMKMTGRVGIKNILTNTKMLKKFILFLTMLFLFPNIIFANNLDFYGEKDNSLIYTKSVKNNINEKLQSFYAKSGVNTDIVVLGKNDECYLENNFESCVQQKKAYTSDLIIVLSMKSDRKQNGEIRSLIKDDFKEIITPLELKNSQDLIIPYFKNDDFESGISELLNILQEKIHKKCEEIDELENCNVSYLAKNYKSFKNTQNIIHYLYYILIVIFVIAIYYLMKFYYKRSLKNIYDDIKFKILNIGSYEIFEIDRDEVLNNFEILENLTKEKLGDLDKNTFKLRKNYKEIKSKFDKIDKKLQEMIKSFSERENLKNKVDDFKNINL